MDDFTAYFQAGLGVALIVMIAAAARGVWCYATRDNGLFERMYRVYADYMSASKASTEAIKASTEKLIQAHEIHASKASDGLEQVSQIKAAIWEACNAVESLAPHMGVTNPDALREITEGVQRIRHALDN